MTLWDFAADYEGRGLLNILSNMTMPGNNHGFVAWEEHILCHERGKRVVHYYLKDVSGDLVLAVVGTERSIRHMMYVVSDEFVKAYGPKGFLNSCTKWRARREVVDWLTSLVSRQRGLEVSSTCNSILQFWIPFLGILTSSPIYMVSILCICFTSYLRKCILSIA